MRMAFDTYEEAKSAFAKINANRRKKLKIYRVFSAEDQQFVIENGRKLAIGEAGEFFGIQAEPWPRSQKETEDTLAPQMSLDEVADTLKILTEQVARMKRVSPPKED